MADRVYDDASQPTVQIEVDGRVRLRFGSTDRGPVALWLPADVFLLLCDRIEQELLRSGRGDPRVLPTAVEFQGVEPGSSRSPAQLRLLLEDGSKLHLPIQESALSRLHTILVEWFSAKDQEDQD